MKLKRFTTKKIAVSGLFLALALIVSLLENLLPPIIPMLPYAKIGFSNIVLLMCFLLVGVWEGYVVLVLKCLLAAIFAGNFSVLIWSLPSAFVAYTAMVLLHQTKQFSTTGLSIAGGMIHNLMQIAVATIVVGSSVFVYLPYMLLAGGIAGLVTGLICHFFVENFKNTLKIPNIKHEPYHRESNNESNNESNDVSNNESNDVSNNESN